MWFFSLVINLKRPNICFSILLKSKIPFSNRIIRRSLSRRTRLYSMYSILDSTLQKYLNKSATSGVLHRTECTEDRAFREEKKDNQDNHRKKKFRNCELRSLKLEVHKCRMRSVEGEIKPGEEIWNKGRGNPGCRLTIGTH